MEHQLEYLRDYNTNRYKIRLTKCLADGFIESTSCSDCDKVNDGTHFMSNGIFLVCHDCYIKFTCVECKQYMPPFCSTVIDGKHICYDCAPRDTWKNETSNGKRMDDRIYAGLS